MFSEAKVTEIFIWRTIFVKICVTTKEKYMVKESNHNHRNKPNRMNDAEIMVILIFIPFGWIQVFQALL